jgi:hypothetical protein
VRAGLDDRTIAVNRVQFVERFAQSEFSIGRFAINALAGGKGKASNQQ